MQYNASNDKGPTYKIQAVGLDSDQVLVDKKVNDVGIRRVGGDVGVEAYAEQAGIDGGVLGEADLQSVDASAGDVEGVLDVVALGARGIQVLDGEGVRIDQLVGGAVGGFIGGEAGAVKVLQPARLAEIGVGVQNPNIAAPRVENQGDGLRRRSQGDLGVITAYTPEEKT